MQISQKSVVMELMNSKLKEEHKLIDSQKRNCAKINRGAISEWKFITATPEMREYMLYDMSNLGTAKGRTWTHRLQTTKLKERRGEGDSTSLVSRDP